MMQGKTVLVTGANSGMGHAACAMLADMGAQVVMLCRSQARGQQALDALMRQPGRNLHLMFCDLASMASIRAFSKEFHARFDHLDALVNNAGVITPQRRETADGLELQFGVNHIGHFMLTLLLLDLLEKAQAGRVVVVGSGAHNVGKIHFDDIHLQKYNVVKSYSQSKLANLLFVRELARRLQQKGSRVTVNAAHPGAVATQMGVDRETHFGKTIVAMLKPFFLTPEQGAATAVFLAADASVAQATGRYFVRCRPYRTSKRSKDMDTAKRLFDLSEQLCGVRLDDVLKG